MYIISSTLGGWKYSKLRVPGHRCHEVEFIITKFMAYKSQVREQIPAELFQAVIEILVSGFHKLINSICNKEEWNNQ
jgi:hypothetical protein